MLGTAMLNGACSIDINATLDWQGGTINNTGVNTVYGQLLIRGAGIKTLGNGTTIENAGTVTWSTGNFSLFSGATFNNQMGAIFNVEGDNTITGDGTGAINNAGTIWKLNGTGTTRIMSTALNNAGDVSVTSGGSLSLMGGGTHTGTFSHTTGSFVDFEGGTHIVDTSLVSNGGTVRFAGGTTTVNGTYTYPEIVAFGNVNFNGPVNVSDSVLIQSANAEVYFNSPSEVQIPFARVYGSIFGSADVAITDSLRWTAGEIGTTGTFSVESGAEFRMEGAPARNDHALTNGVTLSVAGSVFFSIANLSIDATSIVDIQPGGVFNITGLDDTISGPGSISNFGSLFKWFDAGSVTIGADVVNNASLEIQTGTLMLTGDFTHSDGAVIQGGGTLTLTGATISGFEGDVNPGTSPGLLTIIGDLPQGTASQINIEVDGTAPGTEYDRLDISGAATFGGVLNIVTSTSPVLGDTFTVVGFGYRTSGFSGVAGLDLGGGLQYNMVWSDTTLTLAVAEATPSPPGTDAEWLGTTSADWAEPTNWSSGLVPDDTTDVYVQSGTPNDPTINASTTIDTVIVASGATLSVGTGVTLTVNGDVDGGATIVGDGLVRVVGAGATISGTLPNLEVTADATISDGAVVTGSLAANGSGTVLQLGGALSVGGDLTMYNGQVDLNGNRADVAGNVSASATGASVIMDQPGDTLWVAGNASFGGGTTALSDGVILLGGDFSQVASIGAFQASGTHKVVFQGTGGSQAVSMTSPYANDSHFQDVEVTNPDGITLATNAFVSGVLTTAGTAPIDGASQTLTNVGDLTVGGDLTLGGLVVANGLSVAGSYSVTTTTFNGTDQTIPAALPYQNLTISGTGATYGGTSIPGELLLNVANAGLTLMSDLTVGGSVTLNQSGTSLVLGGLTEVAGNLYSMFGNIDLNGNRLNVTTNVSINGAGGSITMDQVSDTLAVQGNATFGGSTSALSAGVILLSGDFSQVASTGAFQASGTHKLVFQGTGGSQSASMASPASYYCHFQDVEITNPDGLTVSSNLLALGQLVVPNTVTPVFTGVGATLTVAGLDVDGVTFDNTPLVSSGGTIARFDNVTFEDFAVDATQLTINHPGADTTFTFDNAVFTTEPTGGGFYVSANDNAADANTLTIALPNSSPSDGSAYDEELNGAIIDWFGGAPQGNSWTGGAGDGLWSSAGNWNLGRIPNTTDTVYITLDGTYTVIVDQTTTVYALEVGGTTGEQILSLSNETLTVDSSVVIGSFGAIEMLGAMLNGTGTLNISGGSLSSINNSSVDIPITNNGTLVATSNTSFNATPTAYTSGAGSVLRVDGTAAASGNLTIANGFTNNGTIELTNTYTTSRNVTLTVSSGTLVNAEGNSIDALIGAGGGARYLYAELDNQTGATVTVAEALTIDQDNATHTNAGDIVLNAANLTLTLTSATFENSGLLDATNGSVAINQSGTSPSFTNSGTLTIGTGQTAAFSNGAFAYPASGAIGGTGALSLDGVTADLTNSLDNSTFDINISSSTLNAINGGTLTNVAGETLPINNSTINVPIINNGTLVATYNTSFNATPTAYTSISGSVLRVDGTAAASGNLTIANGFTNNGTIELTNTYTSSRNVTLTVSSGTLVNPVGRTIDALIGTGGGDRYLSAAIDNQGTIAVEAPLTLNNTFTHADAALIQGTSTLDIASATYTSLSGEFEADVAGTAGTLPVTGDLVLDENSDLNVDIGGTTGGDYDVIAVTGDVTIDGTINVSLIGGYTPSINDEVTILTWTGTLTADNIITPPAEWQADVGVSTLVLRYTGNP